MNRTLTAFCLITTILFSSHRASLAQTQWQNYGLTNWVDCVFANDTATFAGTHFNGAFYRPHGTPSWHSISAGIYDTIYDQFSHMHVSGIAATSNALYASTDDTIYVFDPVQSRWSPQHAIELDIWSPDYYGLQSNNDVLFAQVFDYNGVGRITRSEDGGNAWTNMQGMKAMSFSGDHAYFCNYARIYHSADNGANYTQTTNLGASNQIFIHTLVALNDSTILVSTNRMNAGIATTIYRSDDYGQTWDSIAPNPHYFDEMVAKDQMVFATGNLSGIHYSSDGGYTWAPFNDGINTNYVYDLAIHGDYVYAATEYRVYRLDLNTFTGVNEHEALQRSFRLYPNPTSNTVSVENLHGAETVQLERYDLMGKRLLQRQIQDATTRLDISDLPNGAYIITLRTSHAVTSDRLLVIDQQQ